MSRRLPTTPRSQVKNALRRLWAHSRERRAALKRDAYTCRRCGRKHSKAKGREVSVEVHHIDGVDNWDAVMAAVFEHLLCHPDKLLCLCKECHEKEDQPPWSA